MGAWPLHAGCGGGQSSRRLHWVQLLPAQILSAAAETSSGHQK